MGKIVECSVFFVYVVGLCTASLADEDICPYPCTWIDSLKYPGAGKLLAEQGVMRVFCRQGSDFLSPSYLSSLWTILKLKVLSEGKDFAVYEGLNASDVKRAKLAAESVWVTWTQPVNQLNLSPYGTRCWGVVFQSKARFHMRISVNPFYLPLVACLVIGVSLFFSASTLSRNALVFYTSGTVFGTLTFVLVFLFIVGRLFPQKSIVYSLLVGGWAVVAYFVHYAWDSVRDIVIAYQQYVFGYLAVSALLSLAYCYYKGPPTSPRSLHLIQLSLQLISVGLMYNGTQSREISLAIIAIVIIIYILPLSIKKWLGLKWYVMFPPKVNLLTEEEYCDQGRRETERALEELRQFCNSPKCDSWKLVRRFKDPARFAEFTMGSSHVSDNEVAFHKSSLFCSPSGEHEHCLPRDVEDDDSADYF